MLHRRSGDKTAVLACGHVYHADCWAGWAAREQRTCPLCRSRLAIESCVGLSPVNGMASTPPAVAEQTVETEAVEAAVEAVETAEEAVGLQCAEAAPSDGATDENAPPNVSHASGLPEYTSLSYRDLQARAKAAGLRANMRRGALLAALEDHTQRTTGEATPA